MEITKIVITGGPCAGKTTAMSWIQSNFTKMGYRVLFVPETATELITGGVAPWTCGSNVEYQKCQMKLQLEKEKIFEMFYKAMGDKIAEASGLGVGLAYSRKLAQHHDGTLILEESLGGGASFLLTVPAMKENLEDIGLSTTQSDPTDHTDRTDTEKLRIVVADDNLQLIARLEKELSQWYEVKTAHNGAEALKIVEKEEIDIIVSDVMMPIMNGVELCNTVKSRQELSHIPFILLTALNNVDDKAEGLKSGADTYIEKPYSVIQLHYQIENLMKLRNSFQKTVKDEAGKPDAKDEVDVEGYDRFLNSFIY